MDDAAEAPATPETGVGDGNETKPEGEGEGEAVDKVGEGEEGAPDQQEIPGEGVELPEGEHVEGEELEGEHVEGEHVEDEHVAGEETERVLGEGEEVMGEGEEQKQAVIPETKEEEEEMGEEEQFVEPPPDPAAPYNFSDSSEALKAPYELRPDQVAEVEQLWELYQNYTPAYTDLDGFITEKELIYMLKCLLIMTYTPEQLQELIEYCVRPPSPEGHITYEQFMKMVTMRQRDHPIEEELRECLQIFDPDKTALVDRDQLREVLATRGHKMPPKMLENFIKEVDMTNDGTLGIDDVVGTMCIDLNREDIDMLKQACGLSDKNIMPDEGDEEM